MSGMKRLKILGVDYEVGKLPPQDGNLGYSDMTKCIVEISPYQKPAIQAETLLHEIIHMLSDRLLIRGSVGFGSRLLYRAE